MKALRLVLILCAIAAALPALSESYDNRDGTARRTTMTERAAHEDPHAPGYRCHGMSYGTGAQTCGTATGGPVGGIGAGN